MTDIALHVRIFDANPTDDLVEKRRTAVAAISEQIKKRTSFADILDLANGLTAASTSKGKLSDGMAGQVETALKNASPSFVLDGHHLEARVCALLGAATYLSASAPGGGAVTRAEVLALGLWSALSFQKPLADVKLENLRTELLNTARDLATRAMENSRQRAAVPEAAFGPTEADGWPGIEKKWKAGPLKAIDALRQNAALDREEVDVLWWVLGDWSPLYKEKVSTMDTRLAPIVASWELAQFLKRIPAETHKQLILRLVRNRESENLSELITHLGDQKAKLAEQLSAESIVANCPGVFPLLNAISTTGFKIAGDKESRTPAHWAERALLELGLLRVTKLPAPIS